MQIDLTSSQRRTLRARAHCLNPVVMISDAGISPPVLAEIDRNLRSHELIKIRVFSDSHGDRVQLLTSICDQLAAAAVQHIGKILVIYRPRPDDDASATRHARPRPRPPRRTKRSFQN